MRVRKNVFMKLIITKSYFLILAVPLLIWSGCAKEKAPIPAWIEIDSMTLSTIYADQGSANSRFTDAWLYVNSNLVGGFELPARVPVLAEGNTNVLIWPGIQVNGIAGLRSPYLKVVPYQQNHNLTPGGVLKLNTIHEYDTTVLFKYLEDFEGSGGVSITQSNNSAGEFLGVNSAAVAFEGNNCGLIRHNGADNTITEIETLNWITLPKGGVGIFFEMNYKSNTSFIISLLAKPIDGPNKKIGVIGINPSPEWKKIYITISPQVNDFALGNQFKPLIGFARQPSIGTQEVYIDNLKILY